MLLRSLFKKLIPRLFLDAYHYVLAQTGAFLYAYPSRAMVILGVTGTRGKTTTANYLWSVCNAAGFKTGLIGTANIRIGEEARLNQSHMTMPGRFMLQHLLAQMRSAGCEIAIVETPSEGIEQFRERGISYDVLVLNTLYPEYLETHGRSFERLKQMLHRPFAALARQPRKTLRGKPVPKIIAVNAALVEKDLFLAHAADVKTTYGTAPDAAVRATGVVTTPRGVHFNVDSVQYELSLVGSFNVVNALAAIAVGQALGFTEETIKDGLKRLTGVPGRMERIAIGQSFTVFVDYAHDGPSIEAALTACREIAAAKKARVIILLGGEGGGRDQRKRPVMGQIAAHLADACIVSNVDPYEDDPLEIIEDIARAAEAAGKQRGTDLFAIEDRRAGIAKALALAQPNDVVLVTGKGAEQSIVIRGVSYDWDDRLIVAEALKQLSP